MIFFSILEVIMIMTDNHLLVITNEYRKSTASTELTSRIFIWLIIWDFPTISLGVSHFTTYRYMDGHVRLVIGYMIFIRAIAFHDIPLKRSVSFESYGYSVISPFGRILRNGNCCPSWTAATHVNL